MAAPVAIAHTHVHSMRLSAGKCAGAEALVARVRTADGKEGYGFTLNEEAAVARDMAAWDALARSKAVPLYALLGGTYRSKVKIEQDQNNPALPPDWDALRKGILDNRFDLLRIDPFACGSVEQFSTIAASAAAFDLGIALLAPNAHPWEIQYCAGLAATVKGDDTKIIVRSADFSSVPVPSSPGIGVDWNSEPGFSKLQWQN